MFLWGGTDFLDFSAERCRWYFPPFIYFPSFTAMCIFRGRFREPGKLPRELLTVALPGDHLIFRRPFFIKGRAERKMGPWVKVQKGILREGYYSLHSGRRTAQGKMPNRFASDGEAVGVVFWERENR